METPQFFGMIVAAGVGSRFGGDKPKQYQMLGDKTVLEHSIHALLSFAALAKLVVVLHSEDCYWQTLSVASDARIITAIGGALRSDSVINGLHALAPFAKADDFVLIHDAARPYLLPEDLQRLINGVKAHEVGGILAAPVVDTIKFSQDGQTIDSTIPREKLYRALTPQCFRYAKLMEAYANLNGINASDDAMALELAGFHPLLVKGDSSNIKITYPKDLRAPL